MGDLLMALFGAPIAHEDHPVRAVHAALGIQRALTAYRERLRAERSIEFKVRMGLNTAARQAEGAAAGTINREVVALGRMYRLALQAGRLTSAPHIPKLEEAPPRQGFFEHGEYLVIRGHLPPTYQDALDFGCHSGWRRGEIIRLEWRDVDRDGRVIRLRPELSKTKEGRALALSGPLAGVIERRWQARALGCPFVFHMAGRPIGDWRKTWVRATEAAGLPGKLFHDLRRTVARNLVRSGVPERVAMAITGHKTRSIFDRYNIVSEADLRQATARLAEYVDGQSARGARGETRTEGGQSEGGGSSPPPLTARQIWRGRRDLNPRPLA
jgi:integrase